jgi:anti-sigma factor RsiW
MECRDARKLLDAYVDRELDLTVSLEVEQHLRNCQACARMYENRQTLRDAIRTGSPYFEAPIALRTRITAALPGGEEPGRFPGMAAVSWQKFAFAFAVIAIVSWGLVAILRSPSQDDLLAEEVIAGHVRSLMADHLTDVPSSDQHTVKPWFEGKLDFSPRVADLTQKGFTLEGGRLDYIGNKAVAALVYQRRKHFINLYVWLTAPGPALAGKTWTRQGYNLVRWTDSDMTYWAVSDVSPAELEEFARLVQNPS